MQPELEEALSRICSSPGFARSVRLQRFLRYILAQAFTGDAEMLKEYAIAVAVYDKPASFDPQQDPIVRVEAGRLRARLVQYYADPGCSDRVTIDLPKGTYLPVLRPRTSAPSLASSGSLAVLPLRQITNLDLHYLVEGLGEQLTIAFARLGTVRIGPWSSVLFALAGGRDMRTAADMLGAQTLLVLSANAADADYDIHAEWIDPRSDTHLWGKRYHFNHGQLASIQADIFAQVAAHIAPHSVHPSQAPVQAGISSIPQAFQIYLKARYLWNKRTPDALVRAIRQYREALDLDPVFALAYAGMADAYLTLGTFLFLAPQESLPRAKQAAQRALEIDPSLAAAHTTLACARAVYDYAWDDAERLFRRALALEPQYAVARQWFGFCLCAQGRFEEGGQQIRAAHALDPLSPMIETQIAAGLYLERRYEEAAQLCERVLETDPYFWAAQMFAGVCYLALHHSAQAVAALRRACEYSASTPMALASLSHALALSGAQQEATALQSTLLLHSATKYVPAYCCALIACGLGNTEESLRALESAGEEHSPALALWLKGEPRLDPLRAEPRFQQLVAKLHLD